MAYLLEQDRLEHIVIASLKAKRYEFVLPDGHLLGIHLCRLPEAIRLVEMYYQDKDKFAGAEALKVCLAL